MKFIVKYINIRENGNQSLRPIFIQAINAIKSEDLDSPAKALNLSQVLTNFARADITKEGALLDQANLLALESKDLASAPRIAQTSTLTAARLGITDQSGAQRKSAVALIGGPSPKGKPQKNPLQIDNAFLEVIDSYGLRFMSLREEVIEAVQKAINENAESLLEYLPASINSTLNQAMTRTQDDSHVSLVDNEAKELLKVFATVFESPEIKRILSENKIQISPSQFFISQIFLKYFQTNTEQKREFYTPILSALENNYQEFDGISALINESLGEVKTTAVKTQEQEDKAQYRELINQRKSDRILRVKSFAKRADDSLAKTLQNLPIVSEAQIKSYIQKQDIKSFISNLADLDLGKELSNVFDHDIEEYRLDFIRLVTGIEPLFTLNHVNQSLGPKIPVVIDNKPFLIAKTDLISLVQSTISRKLMRAVHADTAYADLKKAFSGVDDLEGFANQIYDYLNSRKDLLDIGTAWSDKESQQLSNLVDFAKGLVMISNQKLRDEESNLSKTQEAKLKEAVEKSQDTKTEVLALRKDLEDMRKVVLSLIELLAAKQRPDGDTLERLRIQISDQSTKDTVLLDNLETKLYS